MATPYLVYDKNEFERLIHDCRGFLDLYNYLEKTEDTLKDAIDYSWANSHIYVTDIFGRLAIHLSPDEDSITFYNAQTKDQIYTVREYNDLERELRITIYNIEAGHRYCHGCKQWFDADEVSQWGYAGVVCHECRAKDPSKYPGPDSSG